MPNTKNPFYLSLGERGLRFEGFGLGIYGIRTLRNKHVAVLAQKRKDHMVGSVGNNIIPCRIVGRNQNKGEDPWRLRFSNNTF